MRSLSAVSVFAHDVTFLSRLEAEDYRNLPRQDLLLIRSKALIRKYIHLETATHPLGLSDEVREKILDLERRAIVGPGLLIEAQMQVRCIHKTSHCHPTHEQVKSL